MRETNADDERAFRLPRNGQNAAGAADGVPGPSQRGRRAL